MDCTEKRSASVACTIASFALLFLPTGHVLTRGSLSKFEPLFFSQQKIVFWTVISGTSDHKRSFGPTDNSWTFSVTTLAKSDYYEIDHVTTRGGHDQCPATRKERKGKIEIPSGRDFSAGRKQGEGHKRNNLSVFSRTLNDRDPTGLRTKFKSVKIRTVLTDSNLDFCCGI